jgi:tetratricopeptide (TPR) repeat protein/photosystem II stability/assembly factor-like uncharacterized protein
VKSASSDGIKTIKWRIAMPDELTGNPYVVGPTVTGEQLYGRQEVFQFVQESLAGPANRVIVLHGQRRVGKSSVLQELHLHRLPSKKYCAVRIDVQGQAQTPFSTAIHDLAAHIAEALGMEEPDLADYQREENYFVQTFLPEALSRLGKRRLVIMIDEFDALAQDESGSSTLDKTSAGARFVPVIQAILDNSAFDKVVFVLVIGCSLEKLPPAFSQLIRGARFSPIWLLSQADARTLITKPAERILSYEDVSIDRIWHYTSGHPYFTQLLCYEVFNRAKRRQQTRVKANDIDQIIDAALEGGAPAFVWLWEALSIAERLLISAIGSVAFETGVASKEDIQNILIRNRIRLGNVDLVEAANHLVREHVLQFEGQDGYRFEVELVRLWVKKNHNLSQEKLKISEMSRTATSYHNVARRSHDRGRLEAAIEGYRLALQDNPNHFNAQLGLAQALWDQGSLSEAVEEYENAYWLNEEASLEGLVGVRMALAESLEAKGQHVEAAVHYRRVHELSPDYRPLQEKLRIFYDKGNQARNRENWPEATEFLERVVDVDPNYRDACQQLVRILYTQGRQAEDVGNWSKAAQFFGRVVDIDPDYEDAARRRDDCEAKVHKTILPELEKPVAPPPPPRPIKSLAPIVGAVVVVLALLGGIGGWLIWGGGPAPETPTPTQAIANLDRTPTTQPTTEATIEATQEPTLAPTEEPTKEPSPEPTVEPTLTQTEAPTPEPTSTPTEAPTVESTNTPTQEPTLISAPTETPAPTSTSTEEPVAAPVPLPPGEALDVDINPQSPEELFVLLKNGSIYRTGDQGNEWKEVLPADPAGLSVLTIAPGNTEVIYIGAFGKIIKSSNGGDDWQSFPLPGPVQINALAIAGNNPDIVYAATGSGILISQDGGENWVNGKNSDGADLMATFYAVAIETGRDGPIYTAGEGDTIYRADGPGAYWQPIVCHGCASPIYALAARGDTVYAGGALASLARSDNRGNDWRSANNGIADPSVPTLDISSITLAPNGDIYAGTGFRATNANGLGVVQSIDGGNSWIHLPLPSDAGNNYYVQSIAIHPDNLDIIYIAGFGGVHKSEDGGQTWIKQ